MRYGYGKDPWKQYAPELIARPSVVPGREHQIRIRYNSSRQPLQITETGFSPLDAQGQPAGNADGATPIERSTRYRYTEINGRSVLVDIDGPLPTSLAGYDDGSPAQNDLTRLRWDRSGSHVTRVLQPDGTAVALEHDKAGRIIQMHSRDPSAKEDETGWRTELRHDAQARLVAMRSLAPTPACCKSKAGATTRWATSRKPAPAAGPATGTRRAMPPMRPRAASTMTPWAACCGAPMSEAASHSTATTRKAACCSPVATVAAPMAAAASWPRCRPTSPARQSSRHPPQTRPALKLHRRHASSTTTSAAASPPSAPTAA